MKDSKAREMINDLEYKIGVELDECLDFRVFDPSKKYHSFEYRFQKIGVKKAVELILQYLGLELEYIPSTSPETKLKKVEEESND